MPGRTLGETKERTFDGVDDGKEDRACRTVIHISRGDGRSSLDSIAT